LNSSSLWEKYCSFYKQDFNTQANLNEGLALDHLDAWCRTVTAKSIAKGKKPNKIDDLPITEYDDYPILLTFGQEIKEEEKREARAGGELLHDYYTRLFNKTSSLVAGYLPDEPVLCMKTTGTTGESKWIVHTKKFNEGYMASSIALVLMTLSKEWGEKVLEEKPNTLNLVAPVPYISGWATRFWDEIINFIPPISYTDNVADMGKKFYTSLKMIEKGNKIHMIGGSGALLYMACKYFSDPQYFLSMSYNATPSMSKKFLILLKQLSLKLGNSGKKDLREIMPLRGVLIGSTDARFYTDFFKEEFGVEPLNSYGATELGSCMFGRPDRKLGFFPNLKTNYFEFLDEKGEVRKLSEVKKGEMYELVATPFYSIFVRYRIRDIFRVSDFYDEMPVFTFEGRAQTMMMIYDYYRLTEDLMAEVIVNAGFKASDRWAATKTIKPNEVLIILFEREWPLTEREAEKAIFNSMLSVQPEFSSYVHDFNIKKPSEAVKVEFLERGTFTRYAMRQARKNVPLGQFKPPKIITPEKSDILEELRECSLHD
jgi:hypothetical protein